MIQVRYSTSPSSVETAHAADLRDNFLVADLFETGEVHAVYTHEDRLVVGGATPGSGQLELPAWTDVLGVDSHLQRRELGIINVGESGHVRATDAAGNTDPTPAVRRWTVDTVGPVIRIPGRRPPTIRVTVRDRISDVRRRDVVLRVDGRRVSASYDARRGRLTWKPGRSLGPGMHVARVTAVDTAGNRSAATWRFRR